MSTASVAFFSKKDGMRRVCLRIMRLPLAIFGVK